jgi:hypothetical protein
MWRGLAVGGREPRDIIRRTAGIVMAAGLFIADGQSSAGHSVGHYPSYYPDEIRIDTIEPSAAARGLIDETLHAYIGAAPSFAGPVPEHVKPIRSLGSFLVLSFNTASARFASAEARCTAARGMLATLGAEKTAGFVFHPYPITPYHADYLHHLDRVEAAATAVKNAPAAPSSMKVGARGRAAEAIIKARWGLAGNDADAVLEEVPADGLIASAGVSFDGWSAPPWVKEGWFQAHQMLTPALDANSRRATDETYEQLIRGETIDLVKRVNLERRLVAALANGCGRVVAGYVPKEEYISDRYPAGIENVAFDSLSGLNSPVFIRTVKLKDYPWNGKAHLGVRDRPTAAWNPVAGFTDTTGRLIWAAVGDPAMIHFPFNSSWMPNRVQSTVEKVAGQSGGIRLPEDAVRPEPGTGMLRPVGARTFSSAKVVYEVLASPFEDGTVMEVADALYPFIFAYRWGSKAGTHGTHEPRLAATFAVIQERLAGLKVLRVEETKHAIAEGMEIDQKTPVAEVYLRNVPGDERQVSALAPPWSTVPWHLLALMEEAVIRGHAAFSQEEAARRKVPWLDLVRDETLRAQLLDLIARFERAGYRPEPLTDLVSTDEARARWQALRTFAETNGHFLVANGPYRLKEWSPDSVVLQAVREITYPLGFGTFDRFVNPPMAVIDTVTQDAGRITVGANAEMVVKMGRAYKLTSEPLSRTTMRGTFGLLVVSRYLLIGPDGTVLDVNKMQWLDDGRFAIDLPQRLPPGQYTVVLTILLDGNSMLPSARMLRIRIGDAADSGSREHAVNGAHAGSPWPNADAVRAGTSATCKVYCGALG